MGWTPWCLYYCVWTQCALKLRIRMVQMKDLTQSPSHSTHSPFYPTHPTHSPSLSLALKTTLVPRNFTSEEDWRWKDLSLLLMTLNWLYRCYKCDKEKQDYTGQPSCTTQHSTEVRTYICSIKLACSYYIYRILQISVGHTYVRICMCFANAP